MKDLSNSLTAAEIATYIAKKGLQLEQRAAQWRGACPIHGGSRDSFSLNAEDGVWYCHSECQRGGNLFDLEMILTGAQPDTARAAVLSYVGRHADGDGMAELQAEITSARAAVDGLEIDCTPENPQDRRIVAEYDYKDAQGKLLFQCVRFEPKNFCQRRPDGDGGWIWNLEGIDPVPYRLAQLQAAQDVYVCEGEKDVHTLEGFGFVATCNPMGAGKWRQKYSEFLRGKRVIVIPDNDTPGRKHAASVAESLIGVADIVFIIEVPPPAKDVTEFAVSGGTGEQIASLVTEATLVTAETLVTTKTTWGISDSSSRRDSGLNSSDETQVEILLSLAGSAKLFHTPGGENYADIPVGGHRETWSLKSQGFEDWLRYLYFQKCKTAPNPQSVRSAVATLHARARFEGEKHDVYVRVASASGCVYLDLVNEDWEAVQIDATGWRVVQHVPVYFRRSRGMGTLPKPQRGGSLADLRKSINAPDDDTFIPLIAWLIGSLHPTGPYPVLCLQGEQGTAKSTLARILRHLLDPATSPLRTVAKDERDLMITAENSWVLAFDNLSGISPWMSDALCRLATGGGFSTRELFSNKEETLFNALRPIILNGIDEVATRQDLVDRSLIVSLSPIPDKKRCTEERLWRDFEAARPALLGAVCTAISTALRNVATTVIPESPRMADFAKWVVAAEPALPWTGGDFIKSYRNSRKHAMEVNLEADVVAPFITEFIEKRNSWIGTASELLANLDTQVTEQIRKSRQWPKGAVAMSNKLRRAATFLRSRGIEVEYSREPGTGRRLIQITRGAVTPVTAGTAARNPQPVAPVATPTVTNTRDNRAADATTLSQSDSSTAWHTDRRDGRDGSPTRSKSLSDEIDEMLEAVHE